MALRNRRSGNRRRVGVPSATQWLLGALALFVTRDAPAHVLRAIDPPTSRIVAVQTPQPPRVAPWAQSLRPIEIAAATSSGPRARVRLYGDDGEIDATARQEIERVAANDGPPHPLTPRLEQLLLRAAYHFANADIVVVSAWRDRAGRHGTGEAIDFKLKGVRARELAAYLRRAPRAGVGVYTDPRTQFVHLDVRDQSYHWIDASPPGVHWREGQLRDPGASKRDASWTPDMDLPQAALDEGSHGPKG